MIQHTGYLELDLLYASTTTTTVFVNHKNLWWVEKLWEQLVGRKQPEEGTDPAAKVPKTTPLNNEYIAGTEAFE